MVFNHPSAASRNNYLSEEQAIFKWEQKYYAQDEHMHKKLSLEKRNYRM